MKRRFDFRLARVLRVRRVEARIASASFALAERAAREAELRRDEVLADVGRAQSELRDMLAPGPDRPPSDRRDPDRIVPRVALIAHEQISRQLALLRSRMEDALTARARAERMAMDWRARDAARRALERLEERQRSAHLRCLERSDEKAIDERTSARHAERTSVPVAVPFLPKNRSGPSLPPLR